MGTLIFYSYVCSHTWIYIIDRNFEEKSLMQMYGNTEHIGGCRSPPMCWGWCRRQSSPFALLRRSLRSRLRALSPFPSWRPHLGSVAHTDSARADSRAPCAGFRNANRFQWARGANANKAMYIQHMKWHIVGYRQSKLIHTLGRGAEPVPIWGLIPSPLHV